MKLLQKQDVLGPNAGRLPKKRDCPTKKKMNKKTPNTTKQQKTSQSSSSAKGSVN